MRKINMFGAEAPLSMGGRLKAHVVFLRALWVCSGGPGRTAGRSLEATASVRSRADSMTPNRVTESPRGAGKEEDEKGEVQQSCQGARAEAGAPFSFRSCMKPVWGPSWGPLGLFEGFLGPRNREVEAT